jgi:hypothetical protein
VCAAAAAAAVINAAPTDSAAAGGGGGISGGGGGGGHLGEEVAHVLPVDGGEQGERAGDVGLGDLAQAVLDA